VADQKLKYVVETDTTGAVRDLDKLGRAGEDAGKQIAEGFDTASTKSQQAIDKLITGLDEVTAESRKTVAAVGTIGDAFGEGFDPKAAAGIVQALRRAGAEFDDIEGKAGELAAAMKRVDDVRLDGSAESMRGMSGELDHVTGGLEKVHGEADQSRSVLANLAGNTAQDLGQLGGVVGSLGVGIGQLAEYAVDGNIALKNLAGLAGPMALLAAAGAGVQSVMKNIAETKAFNVDQIKSFSEAFADVGDTATALSTALDGVFNARVDNDSLWGQLTGAQKTKDLATDLAAVGVTLSDIDRIIRSGASDRASFELLPDVQNLDSILQSAGLSVDQYEAIMDGVFETTQNWTKATDGASQAAEFFGSSLQTVNEAIEAQLVADNPFTRFDQGLFQTGGHLVDLQSIWNDVVRDMKDDDASFDTTAGNIDILAEAMGKTAPEVVALAMATAHAAKETENLAEHTEAASGAAKHAGPAFGELSHILNSTDWDATSIQATSSAMQEFFDSATRSRDAVAGVYDALNALQDAFKAQRKAGGQDLLPNLSTPEGRATMDALEQLGTSLIPDIQKAFDDSNGSADKFNESMTGLYQRTLNQLADQLHITQDEAKQLLAQIGLTPESFSTQYEMIGTEEAKLKLQLLQGVISSLPTDVQAQIAYKISMGDYVGAVNTVVTYGQNHPVVLPSSADMTGAKSDTDAFRRQQANTPVTIPVRVSTYGGGRLTHISGGPTPSPNAANPGVAALAGPVPVASVSFPTAAPARSPVTVNVAIRAGAIGNRFDVERAVVRAVRSATRVGALAVPA
jgi:hypothetical protein